MKKKNVHSKRNPILDDDQTSTYGQLKDDLHFTRSSYNYRDNYSDDDKSHGFRTYQDYSESGLVDDEVNQIGDDKSNFSPRETQASYRSYQTPNSFYDNTRFEQQHMTGPHSGKGPKNYKRSDERINEEVCEILSHNPEIDASGIEVQVRDGVVILSGTVESRHIKRLAEQVVEHLPGIVDINNSLRIDTTLVSKGVTHESSRGV